MELQFVWPENPVPIADQDELARFLDLHTVNYRTWNEKRLEQLWKEIEVGDTLLTVEPIPFMGRTAVFRNIRTVTVRIQHNTPDQGGIPDLLRSEILVEFKIREGEEVPRKHKNTSLSEKMLWNSPGCEESPESAIIRGILEELGVRVSANELNEETLFPMDKNLLIRMVHDDQLAVPRKEDVFDLRWQYPQQRLELARRGIDLDVRFSGVDKFPGLVVRNQLVHRYFHLPEHHYRKVYVDPGTRYVSRWVFPGGMLVE